MGALEQQLGDAIADGRMSAGDADALRTFGAFLEAAGPTVGAPGHDPERFWPAYAEHYPDEHALLVAERERQKAVRASDPPSRGVGSNQTENGGEGRDGGPRG